MQPTTWSMTELRRSDAAALTASEVASLFGVDARTISTAIANGELPSVRIGRRVFIPREPLLAMLSAPAGNGVPVNGNG